MTICGAVHKYGSNIDTDVIIPARYLNTSEPSELAEHCMEDIDSGFVQRVKRGDIIVAEQNFGCGSSREHAPVAIKACGVSCVIAASFARIFYRNSINTGLPILECTEAAQRISGGDSLEVDFQTGIIKNLTRSESYKAQPFPPFIAEIIASGGLLRSIGAKMTEIRHGTADDIDRAAYNICEAWKIAYAGIIPDKDIEKYANEDFKAASIRSLWEKGLRFFVASVGGNDCGVCSYMKSYGKYGIPNDDNSAYIVQLYVHPDYQHSGIGSELIKRTCEELKRQGCKQVILDTPEKNADARVFYEKNGFELSGTAEVPIFSEKVVTALYKKEL